MSSAKIGVLPGIAELMQKLERVLAERQKIIECGDALATTGQCCSPSHTPHELARDLASLLRQQKFLLHSLAALLPPERAPI